MGTVCTTQKTHHSFSNKILWWENYCVWFAIYSRPIIWEAKAVWGLWSRWWFYTCSDGKSTEFGSNKDLDGINANKLQHYDKLDTDTKKLCYLCFKGCATIKTPKVCYEMPSTFQHFTNQRSSYFFYCRTQ